MKIEATNFFIVGWKSGFCGSNFEYLEIIENITEKFHPESKKTLRCSALFQRKSALFIAEAALLQRKSAMKQSYSVLIFLLGKTEFSALFTDFQGMYRAH